MDFQPNPTNSNDKGDQPYQSHHDNHHQPNHHQDHHAHPQQDVSPPAMHAVAGRADDEMFCHACGKTIKRTAAFCQFCGASSGKAAPAAPAVSAAQSQTAYPHQQSQQQYIMVPANPEARDKVVAILLAVFVGFFTWIYTYKRDTWKFWLNLVLSIITLGIWAMVAWLWAVIDVAVKPEAFYREYPNYKDPTKS